MSGTSCSPEAVGLSPRTTCWKSGRYVSAPKSAKPTTKPTALVMRKTGLRNRRSGRIGSAARRSAAAKATRARTPSAPSPTISARAPVERRPAERRDQHDRRQADRQQQRPEPVDDVPGALPAAGQGDGQDAEGGQAERQVDVEDRAPADVRREEAADERPEDRRDAEDGAEEPGVLAALARRDDVPDRRLRGHHEPAAAEALHRAEGDELRHDSASPHSAEPMRNTTSAPCSTSLRPSWSPELAVERRDDGDGQQVGGDDPREVLEPAEVADDRRQRGRDDRLVQRRQQHDEHEPADDDGQPGSPLVLHAPGGTR